MKKLGKTLVSLGLAVSMVFSGQYISGGTDNSDYVNATEVDTDTEATKSDTQDDIELVGKAGKNKEVTESFEITSDNEQFVLISVCLDNGNDDKEDIIRGYITVDALDNENYSQSDCYYSEEDENTRSLILGKGKHTISMLMYEDVDYSIHISFSNMKKNKDTDNLIYYKQGAFEESSFGFKLKEKKKVSISVYGYDTTSEFISDSDYYDINDDNESWIFFGTKKQYEEELENIWFYYDSYSECKHYYRFGGRYKKSYYDTIVLEAGSYVFDFTAMPDNIEIAVEDASVYATDVKAANSKSVTMLENSTIKWKYFVFPQNTTNKTLIWKSSNNKIAKVDKNGSQYVSIKGIKPGKCELLSVLKNGTKVTVNVVVKARNPKLNYTKKALLLGETVKLKLNYAKNTVKYSSSNKNIATVTKNGTVKAKNRGKCTIWVKCGKKKYGCKITVKKTDPNFYACIYDYSTRDNYFTVKFKNAGKTSVTIKKGIKVIDIDYKFYDRNVYMKKSVTIKPGKTKYIRFYVKGSNTWYNYRDFTLYYKFVFDHKEYEGHVWDEDSVFREGKKWYSTYWRGNEDDYEDWLPWSY